MHMYPTRSFFLFRGASVPCPMTFSGLVRNAHFLPYIILASSVSFVPFPMSRSGKSRIFLSYPMSCLPRVARPPFGVMLWQKRAVSPSSSLRGLGKLPARNMPMFRVPLLYRHCEAWKSRIFRKFKTNSSSPSSSLRGLEKPNISKV